MATITAALTPAEVRPWTLGWEKAQHSALNTVGRPSTLVARGAVVTATRMDIPALDEWSWITDTWEGITFGELRGYNLADTDGRELGIILLRGRLVHGEWLNPATGDYEFAGQGRTVQIAANYILDRHDHLARVAGRPRLAEADQVVQDRLVADWVASWTPAEPEPVAYGTRVRYEGSLTRYWGEEFTVQSHNHMYRVTDLDDDCECDTRTTFTLMGEDRLVLTHVQRKHFTPVS